MLTKSDPPISLLEDLEVPAIILSYFELFQLKQLYRQGWLKRGIPSEVCESVAEHSFGVALLALWLADTYYPELDTQKVLCMALLHDFGEVYAGDIIPGDQVPIDEKRARELSSVEQVFSKLPGGEEYIDLWKEFEMGDSPEARFVRQIDRLEMGFQAAVYRSQGFDGMDEFFQSAEHALSDPVLLGLLETLKSL